MLDFFSTVAGRRFIEGTLPNLVHELKRFNDRADVSLNKFNEFKQDIKKPSQPEAEMCDNNHKANK